MPPFNFLNSKLNLSGPIKLSTAAASSTVGPSVQSSAGIAVPGKLDNWLKYSFLPYAIPFAVQILEKIGIVKWYKSTDQEKENLARHYGDNKFYQFCKVIDDNIDFIKTGVFIVYVGLNGLEIFLETEADTNGNDDRIAGMLAAQQAINTVYSIANLSLFIVYDVVGMIIKRHYTKKTNKKIPLRSNSTLTDHAVDLELGSYKPHDDPVLANSSQTFRIIICDRPLDRGLRKVSTQSYEGIPIARYELPAANSNIDSKLTLRY